MNNPAFLLFLFLLHGTKDFGSRSLPPFWVVCTRVLMSASIAAAAPTLQFSASLLGICYMTNPSSSASSSSSGTFVAVNLLFPGHSHLFSTKAVFIYLLAYYLRPCSGTRRYEFLTTSPNILRRKPRLRPDQSLCHPAAPSAGWRRLGECAR